MAQELICDRVSKLELLFKQLSEWVHFQPPIHNESGISSGSGFSNCDRNDSTIDNDSSSLQSSNEENQIVIKMELADEEYEIISTVEDELHDPTFTPDEDSGKTGDESEKSESVSKRVDSVVKFNLLKSLECERKNQPTRIEYQCQYCEDKFKRPTDLSRHMNRMHSREKDFVVQNPEPVEKICYFCNKVFRPKTAVRTFEEHMMVHTREKPFKCQLCHHETTRERYLQEHSFLIHGIKPIPHKKKIPKIKKMKIPKDKKVKSKKVEKTKKEILKFKCDPCEMNFPTLRSLKLHRKTKHETHLQKNNLCSYCGKSFLTNWILQNHLTSHTKEKRFFCSVCGRGFGTHNILKHHLWNIHRDASERKYACYLCPSRFNFSWRLEAHIRTHTGEKPFKCEKCDYAGVTKQNLKNHMKNC